MSKMFTNYDSNIELDLDQIPVFSLAPMKPIQSLPNTSLLFNTKQEIYGVETKHGAPCDLYFHLDESHGWDLTEFVGNSLVEFRLLTTHTHKVILEKVFSGREIFNNQSNDLAIRLTQEDLKQLRQESYNISVRLIQSDGFYNIFSERDGLLVLR
jgi:hypothetical protein